MCSTIRAHFASPPTARSNARSNSTSPIPVLPSSTTSTSVANTLSHTFRTSCATSFSSDAASACPSSSKPHPAASPNPMSLICTTLHSACAKTSSSSTQTSSTSTPSCRPKTDLPPLLCASRIANASHVFRAAPVKSSSQPPWRSSKSFMASWRGIPPASATCTSSHAWSPSTIPRPTALASRSCATMRAASSRTHPSPPPLAASTETNTSRPQASQAFLARKPWRDRSLNPASSPWS
mmetsp:Transcript_34422/g.82106  ORF Transcript_34422/g.82106 Transcript_34422/m.82106 type:complete len:238 (-) Transcript_34422:2795-3508(-)